MTNTIKLNRIAKLPHYTIGHLYIDGVKVCDTLEDTVRDVKIKHETAIPEGEYPVLLTYSPKFKKVLPLIQHVPNFTGIRIHSGNTAKDTSGCILVGENKVKGKVINSRATFNKLMEILKKERNWKIIITCFAAMFMMSCSKTQYIDREVPVTLLQKDTIILVDTLIQTKLEVVRDSISTGKQYSYLYNKYAYSYAQVGADGLLHHSLGIFPTATVTDNFTLPYKIRYIEKEVPIKVPHIIYKQTWFQQAKGYGFYFLLLVFILFIAVKKII